jgi:uncharacterized protein
VSVAAPPRPETAPQGNVRAAIPYVAPFALYAAFLLVQSAAPDAILEIQVLRLAAVAALLAAVSRRVIQWRPARPAGSVLLGVAVFVVWIGPDLLWPGIRGHWLFQNSITGSAESTIPDALRVSALYLGLRVASSVLVVPIMEELFWRGWMMRWLVNPTFLSVPLGTYTAQSFWIVALLFASEHGPYWEVGLLAGIAYNWWLVRTRNLADCILAHAVTNACLAAYILIGGHWRFWL